MATPRGKRRLLIGLVVLMAAGGTVAIFWPRHGSSIGHTVTYSDGATLTLKEVTYGTEHRYQGGGLRERLIGLLPRKYAAKYASRQNVLRTDQPSVAFWLDRHGTAATTSGLVLCDADGFGVEGSYWMMKLGPPNSTMEGWAFEAWPRRGPTFTVRVYERGQRYGEAALLGEFTVRNPTPDNYPVWAASRLPVTVTNGDLAMTLFDLTPGVGRGSLKWKPAPNPTVSETRAGFRIRWNGQPTRQWRIVTAEASDATGNKIRASWGSSAEPDAEYAELQPHPWLSESAWKLRIGLSQRSNFASEELWTIRDIVLSPTNETIIQTNLQGIAVQFVGLQRRSWLRGTHHVNFRLMPDSSDFRLTLIRALTDRGGQAGEAGSYENPREWAFALDVNSNATRLVELTVALHRTRYFEFVARPQSISTNAPGRP